MPVSRQAAAKRRGAGFEIDLLNHLRSEGFDVERLRLAGANDEGDLALRHAHGVTIIEAKAPGSHGRIDLAGWLREAETEAANYARSRLLEPGDVTPLLVVKARQQPISHAYVVQRLNRMTW